jgi:hypothetical protein
MKTISRARRFLAHRLPPRFFRSIEVQAGRMSDIARANEAGIYVEEKRL